MIIKPTGILFQWAHIPQALGLLTGQVLNEVKMVQESRQVSNLLQFSLPQNKGYYFSDKGGKTPASPQLEL